jgi:hypothetical protein
LINGREKKSVGREHSSLTQITIYFYAFRRTNQTGASSAYAIFCMKK